MLRNSNTHYGALARSLHWGMALIIILSIAAVELHEFFPKGSDPRKALMFIHFQIGMIVFLLVWLRIYVMATDKAPPITPDPPLWQHLAAKSIHLAFYAAMIVLPIIGILTLQSGDKALSLLGIIPLPTFTGVDKELSKALNEVHETIGELVIFMIVAHVAAAVWHHHIKKDDTLLRMLPPKD